MKEKTFRIKFSDIKFEKFTVLYKSFKMSKIIGGQRNTTRDPNEMRKTANKHNQIIKH